MEEDISSYFIKYIDKEYEIRKVVDTLKDFDVFAKDEELIDRYCENSGKKPKIVIICDTDETMQNLFNTIINYDVDFNNICLSCVEILFENKEDANFIVENAFVDISGYI